MPSKKKKYNARFPAGRIKKIMQSDEEIGKVAQAVPVIISRTLELFVESLLKKTTKITNSRNARTLSPSHLKQCIMSESNFDFLKDLVKNIPDISAVEEASFEEGGNGSYDTPGTSNSSEHETNSIRHHLQRSQSLGIGFDRTAAENSNSLLKHRFPGGSGERPMIPAKMIRLNSTPATSTITSTVTSNSELLAPPAAPAFKIEIKSPDIIGNHSNNHNFPIQISYCTNTAANNNATPNPVRTPTSTIPSSSSLSYPAVPSPICPEAAVKICFNNNSQPSSIQPIKFDFTNFNNHQNVATSSLQPPQKQPQTQELDEDYDNL